MKARNNYKLAYLPDGLAYAEKSILLEVNTDIMKGENTNSISSGNTVIAHQIEYSDLIPQDDYIVISQTDEIYIGSLTNAIDSGITLTPNNKIFPSHFIHKICIKGLYRVSEIKRKRNLNINNMTDNEKTLLYTQLQMFAKYMRHIADEIEFLDIEKIEEPFHQSIYRNLIQAKTKYNKLLKEDGFDYVDDNCMEENDQ